MTSHGNKARFGFYGWWLVLISLLVVSIGFGASVYLYSVIADALQQTYPGSRFLLMMGITGLLVAMALMSPKVGRLIDKYPIKYTLIGGSVCMGTGFILIALSTNIWQVIVLYTLFIGAGAATLSGLTVTTLISRWFVRHRGLAIGIAALGSQFGGFVYPPLMAHLIELYEWRLVLAALGTTILVVVPLVTYFSVVDQPHYKGLRPDGDSHEQPDGDSHEQTVPPRSSNRDSGENTIPASAISVAVQQQTHNINLGYLLTQANFLLITLTIGAASAVTTTMIANLSLFATDLGESAGRGAYLVSLFSIVGVVSSPLIGRFCDIYNVKTISVGLFICSAIATLAFTVATSYPLLLFAALIQGTVGGGLYPLWACLVGRVYHTSIYGQMMGATTLVVFLIIAPAPLLAGWIYDFTGSYRVLFILMLTFMVVCAVMICKLQIPYQQKNNLSPKAC